MKRFVIACLLPLALLLAPTGPVEAKIGEKKAKKLLSKWQGRLQSSKKSYFKAAGRYLYWKKTLSQDRKTDAPKADVQKDKKMVGKYAKKEKKGWKNILKSKRMVKRYKKIVERLSGGVHPGKGWGGSEGVADAAKRIAKRMGLPVTSQKRNYAQTIAVGSTTASDHYTGNKTAFAVDFGVSGSRGDTFARALCKAYGIPTSAIGTFNGYYRRYGGITFRIQLLWRVEGHFDHVHIGIRRS